MKTYLKNSQIEPYRLFFPMGVLSLLAGALIWLPQIWSAGNYPILAHRYLMLNGFTAFFIAGFLMTAVPKFSKTHTATIGELLSFILFSVVGFIFACIDNEDASYYCSALQASVILYFLLSRILKRKENPPYSFVFIFAGLILWLISAVMGAVSGSIEFKNLQYEGAVAAIILGVGGRLIPGILGHNEIVLAQRARYEKPSAFLLTVPMHFYAMIILFVLSYFLMDPWGIGLRAIVVSLIAVFYWKLYKKPPTQSALTNCIWICCWMIVASFWLKALWFDGYIHASHSFFLSGIVLLSLLISTRVLQSHGPQQKALENLKLLYVVTGLIIFAAATRVSAYLLPEHYLKHLGYSAIILTLATLLWAHRYLKFVFLKK